MESSYKSNEESKRAESETKSDYEVRPNVQSEDVTKLIRSLEVLSKGLPTSETYEDLSTTAQRVLSGTDLDPIKAIVVPLSSIKAVTKKFLANPEFEVDCVLLLMHAVWVTWCGCHVAHFAQLTHVTTFFQVKVTAAFCHC